MDEMTRPLVSVITPAYNLAHYLPETIESVLSQDYPNMEYIVLDDGSKDNTREVLEAYSGRITWESHENMGEARTVNKGFAMAAGEYIVVVNADDPLRPGMISKLVSYMQQHPDILAVYPDWIEIDQNSEPMHYVKAQNYDYAKWVKYALCVPGPGAMIRRHGLELVEGRNVNYRYVTDMEFWMRLGLYGPLARYPEALATHRTHPTSSGVALKDSVGAELISLMNEFFARPELPADVPQLKRQALASAYFEAGMRSNSYQERQALFRKSFLKAPLMWFDFEYRPPWTWVQMLPETMTKAIWVLINPVKYYKLKQARWRNPAS